MPMTHLHTIVWMTNSLVEYINFTQGFGNSTVSTWLNFTSLGSTQLRLGKLNSRGLKIQP